MTMMKTVAGLAQEQKEEFWKKSVDEQTDLAAREKEESEKDPALRKQFQQITFSLGKFNDEQRTFQAIASTPLVDRQGDSIDQDGWMLDNFIKNPVIPWAHDYYTPPVGRAIEIGVNQQGYLQFTYQAPPEGVYDLADTVWNLYRNQFIFAFSVGFIPQEYEGNWEDGYTFTKCELLEISAVVVPANPQAVALAYKGEYIDERQAKSLRSKMQAATKFLDEAMGKKTEVEEEEAAEDDKDLTKDKEVKDNIDMTKSQKDGNVATKGNSKLDAEEKEQLVSLHKDLEDMQKKFGGFQTKMEAHKVNLQKMIGMETLGVSDSDGDNDNGGGGDDNDADDGKGSEGASKDDKKSAKPAKKKASSTEVVEDEEVAEDENDEGVDESGESETEEAAANPQDSEDESTEESEDENDEESEDEDESEVSDKQDDKKSSKQGEVKSADEDSDDGADQEGGEDVELTDEQEEEFIRAFNEETERLKKEEAEKK